MLRSGGGVREVPPSAELKEGWGRLQPVRVRFHVLRGSLLVEEIHERLRTVAKDTSLAPKRWGNCHFQSIRKLRRNPDTHAHTTKSVCKWGKNLGKTPHAHHQLYWTLRDHKWIFF